MGYRWIGFSKRNSFCRNIFFAVPSAVKAINVNRLKPIRTGAIMWKGRRKEERVISRKNKGRRGEKVRKSIKGRRKREKIRGICRKGRREKRKLSSRKKRRKRKNSSSNRKKKIG